MPPHKRRSPHARTPFSALLFLLVQIFVVQIFVQIFEPAEQVALPVTGKERSLVRPLVKSLRRGRHAHPSPVSADRGFFGSRPFGRFNHLFAPQGTRPVHRRLP
ncbi:hypothetical protein [Streptomyces acidicola]|uniref:hypothetical protein n=1 Tax=Streptomyces acidicola TaxID=2596892 RepID=UPI003F4DC466